MDEKYQGFYRVLSSRASWHAYNGGIYFVTICTKDRVHYFGEISNGEMKLTEIGKITQKRIQQIAEHNPYAIIPLFVIMPNHIYLIAIIEDVCRDVPWRVSTEGKNVIMQNIANKQGRLSTMIGGFKQSITRFARQNNIPFAWQPRFYDRIIRKTDDLNRIAEYIDTNVVRWEYDELYG